MTEKTIRDFKGDDVWRDPDGVIWVRQSEMIDVVNFNRKIRGYQDLNDTELAKAYNPRATEPLNRPHVRALRRVAEAAVKMADDIRIHGKPQDVVVEDEADHKPEK